MKNKLQNLFVAVVFTLSAPVFAQTSAPVATNPPAVAAPRVNTAIVPVSREGKAIDRQNVVLQRAKDNQFNGMIWVDESQLYSGNTAYASIDQYTTLIKQ